MGVSAKGFGMRKIMIVVATAVLAVGSTSLSTSASAFGLGHLGGFGLVHLGFGLAASAMKKNILIRLAVSVALSFATPALAKDAKLTARHDAPVAREIAAPSSACMADQGPSNCGEPMWVCGSAGANKF
jgi:hypothetical protein